MVVITMATFTTFRFLILEVKGKVKKVSLLCSQRKAV